VGIENTGKKRVRKGIKQKGVSEKNERVPPNLLTNFNTSVVGVGGEDCDTCSRAIKNDIKERTNEQGEKKG